MIDLPWRAKRLVLGTIVRSALPWAVPVVGLVTSPWLGFVLIDEPGDLRAVVPLIVVALVVPPLVAIAVALRFPHARFGDWAFRRTARAGGHPSTRTVNLTDQLAIATGTYAGYDVLVVDSPIPNVATFPGATGAHVVVTSGAERTLDRDALEALLATQIVVVSDPWVRRASAAQLVGSLRFVLLFAPGFLNPFLIPLAFLAFTGHRRPDAVRDMVADATALRATRHPEALSRALFELRPAAPHASRLRTGLPGFLGDQFWVLSTRSRVSTTVSGPRGSRAWSTTDEIAAEMAMRADRMRRAAAGDDRALFDLRSWRRAIKGLGTSALSPTGLALALTAEELEAAAHIELDLRR